MVKKLLLLVTMLVWVVGCSPATPGTVISPTITSEGYPGPYPVSPPLFPAKSPTVEVYPQPGTDEADVPTPYPLPSSPEQLAGTSYPAPENTEVSLTPITTPVYPGPESTIGAATPMPTQPREPTTTLYPGPIEQFTQVSPTQGSQAATSTAPDITPTAFLPEYQPTPVPGLFITIHIWHSWSGSQLQVLEETIQVFQSLEPTVSFDLTFVPFDDLAERYESEAYQGKGPTLLLGDSDWVAQFSLNNLVKDLTPYLSTQFIETLSPPALGTVQLKGRTLALPYAMHGVVLYRNKQLIPSAPVSFEELLQFAGQATRGGNVGLYLDWGCYFSCAQMQGLGGHWVDDQGQVQFDSDDYQAALDWLSQLEQIQKSGALVEFNQDQAVNLFKLGKIGMTIDSTGRAWEFAKGIGYDNLAIDTWPVNGEGKMAGYVQTDAIFLNSNVADRSSVEEQAALRFMGLLLTPEVQLRLAEVGFIPTVFKATPRDLMQARLMSALNSGISFPTVWQNEVRQVYWGAIDAAAQSVLERAVPPRQALETAATEIKERLAQIANR